MGMGMTEKQGGSDVRANTTVASPINGGGPGGEYEVTGHKWFMSAPMCDAFLVLAQTDRGVSCFFLPRWLPDGKLVLDPDYAVEIAAREPIRHADRYPPRPLLLMAGARDPKNIFAATAPHRHAALSEPGASV